MTVVRHHRAVCHAGEKLMDMVQAFSEDIILLYKKGAKV